ncbi:MFS transporter, partial [Klebsiella pneumoniae]|uniref:MFS transporter n=1 Tax=Klebsiella pneumoniae TaxID=573 RepID=UPI000E3422CB
TLNIVPALAPLLGGIMAEYYGWRLPFVFLALYAFILLILTAKYLPETRPESSVQHKENPLKSLVSVLFNKRFLIFSLANAG